MTRTLGQQVIVENVAGAGGTLAAGRVARPIQTATRCSCTISDLPQRLAYRKLPYDPARAFAGIGLITDVR